ncbi:hypothetical protein LCGC14_1160760 [marine sediment metagenome]|uniref:Uncharacterized protein n=1 Tax=marine sediment metagenome TaxID=412755 RepID=A0A0F9PB06_9ZZZZ
MEIDIKEEQEKIQQEIQQLTVMANQLQQQRQEVINKVIMKQGQLELLDRLDKGNPSADITKVNGVA